MDVRAIELRSSPLLQDVGAEPCDVEPQVLRSGTPPGVEIDTASLSIAGVTGVVVATAVSLVVGAGIAWFVVAQLLDTSESNGFYKLWILFALVAPLTVVYRHVFKHAGQLYERLRWVRAEVDSIRGASLFMAVANEIEEVAEKQRSTCSSDVEALTEYDRTKGVTSVKLRYWGRRSKTVRVGLNDDEGARRVLLVDYARGDDIVCGRDHSIQNREVLVLRLGASRDRLADKRLLTRWMHRCLKIYEQPPRTWWRSSLWTRAAPIGCPSGRRAACGR